jgi:hypothetical protein
VSTAEGTLGVASEVELEAQAAWFEMFWPAGLAAKLAFEEWLAARDMYQFFAYCSCITTLQLACAHFQPLLIQLTLELANAALHAIPEEFHRRGQGLAHVARVQLVPLVRRLDIGIVDEDSLIMAIGPGGDDVVGNIPRNETLGGVESAGVG